MKLTHPKQYEYIMKSWDEGGLGFKEIIDWINEHGNLNIRYQEVMVLTQEQMRNLNTIVETYGNDAQEDMAIEECSELVKAILKFRRSDEKTAEMREAVIDEIADVQIMLTQLEIIFNCVAEVEDRIDFKINRQMGRIKEREAKRDVC